MLARTEILTGPEMRMLLAQMLTMAAGGNRERWWHLVGNVAVLSKSRDGQSNWMVRGRGSSEERDLIDRAVRVARAEYSYLAR